MVLRELLAPLRDDDGMALPSRYEVIFSFPSGNRGSKLVISNIISQILFGNVSQVVLRDVSMQCNSFEFPGRTLQSAADDQYARPLQEKL